MPRSLLPFVLLFVLPQAAFAQGSALNDSQQLGQRLFFQSCGVCHIKPQINAPHSAPSCRRRPPAAMRT